MAFVDAVAVTPIALVAQAAADVATLVAPDATNGNKFVANGRTMLRVVNASVGIITVTVHTNFSVHGLVLPALTFTVPANTGDVIWVGFGKLFEQNAAGEVWVEFSAVSGVTMQVINPL